MGALLVVFRVLVVVDDAGDAVESVSAVTAGAKSHRAQSVRRRSHVDPKLANPLM